VSDQDFPVHALMNPAHVRKLVKRTVETYPEDWIVVHEMLQNAKDAIQRGDMDSGTVVITMDLAEESATVSDDGPGFPHDIELLALGGTDKDEIEDFGELVAGKQGVGLKAVLYSTTAFEIESHRGAKVWTVRCDGACEYLEGQDTTIRASGPSPSDDDDGTTVRATFPNHEVSRFVATRFDELVGSVDDRLADDIAGKFAVAMEYYFRSYSYAGDVNSLLGLAGTKPMRIVVRVVGKSAMDGFPDALTGIVADGKGFEIDFPNTFWDIHEVIESLPAGKRKPTVLNAEMVPRRGDIGRQNENYVWTAKMTESRQFVTALVNEGLRTPIDAEQYRDLFGQISGIYIVIASPEVFQRFNIERPRQIIAASGVPSAHELKSPTRGADATYVNNNIHIVVNVKADLNYGKQTIPNMRLVGKVNSFFRDAVRATLRNIAENIVGRVPQGGTADDVEGKLDIETELLDRQDMPIDDFSIVKAPEDGNESLVIAVLYELIGRGYLKGLRTYTLHPKTTYDGRFVGQLSNQRGMPEPMSDAELHNIEFKVRLQALIADFEEKDEGKKPEGVQLAVVWDKTIRQHADYEVIEISETDQEDRHFDGVEYVLNCKRAGYEIQLLCLADVVRRIADGDLQAD